MTLSEKLYNLRRKQGLSQEALAEKLNCSRQVISKWENGRAMPDSSIMLELCDNLGISVNELLSGEKIMTKNTNQQNEQLLLEMTKELERKNKSIYHLLIRLNLKGTNYDAY